MPLYIFAILDMIAHVSRPTKMVKTVTFALQSLIIIILQIVELNSFKAPPEVLHIMLTLQQKS